MHNSAEAFYLRGVLKERQQFPNAITEAMKCFCLASKLGNVESRKKLVWRKEIHRYFKRHERECVNTLIVLRKRPNSVMHSLPFDALLLILQFCFILSMDGIEIEIFNKYILYSGYI